MPRPPWTVRRRIVHATLGFCAGVIVYLLGWGGDTRLNETIAFGVIGLAAATIGSYVFGAVWDDSNVIRAEGLDAYAGPDIYPEMPPMEAQADAEFSDDPAVMAAPGAGRRRAARRRDGI